MSMMVASASPFTTASNCPLIGDVSTMCTEGMRSRITKRLGPRPRQDHKHALAVRFARRKLWRDLPRTQSISDQACAAIVKVTGDAFYRTTQAAFEANARQCADSGKHIDCKTSRLST